MVVLSETISLYMYYKNSLVKILYEDIHLKKSFCQNVFFVIPH